MVGSIVRSRKSAMISDSESEVEDTTSTSDSHEPLSYGVQLKVGKYPDELATIIGDKDKPYYDILDAASADNILTIPKRADRLLFERYSESATNNQISSAASMHGGLSRSRTLSRIQSINIRGKSIPTWYSSPYPEEYISREQITICSLCLNYFTSEFVGERHALRCSRRMPPGAEIYRDGKYSIFEVDGALEMLYCQNLCLLAKLFLDSKALYQDVHPFMFYVLTERDAEACHFVGYFSKQKIYASREPASTPILNVSCIMTLPSAQNKGIGQYLIEFSYLLTRKQGVTGSPEKPLSKLGLKAYSSYWTRKICYILADSYANGASHISVSEISKISGLTLDDVVFGLELLGWIVTKNRTILLKVDSEEMKLRIQRWENMMPLTILPSKLLWTPPAAW